MQVPLRRRETASRRRRRQGPMLQTCTCSLFALANLISAVSAGIPFNQVTPPKLDLSKLGQVGIAGDFSGVSLYQYDRQRETSTSTNGSASLYAQLPNGMFVPLVSSDAPIQAMCHYVDRNGESRGVIVGGNFTSLGDTALQGVALFNPNTTKFAALEDGLSGQVNALLCDKDSGTVYMGGNFKRDGSTNAIAWSATSGWRDLGFGGFNGPVSSISKTSTGKLIFGGTFTGLGNTSFVTRDEDLQVVNLRSANITASLGSTRQGFSDPKSVVCKTDFGSSGAGNTWLMQDQSSGFWDAEFGFSFTPTKLRLYNTKFEGRGTKTWRYTVIPDNGIMNFTYIDPVDGRNKSCTSECPLSDKADVRYQDFLFVNRVSMNRFRLDVSDWYGNGAGFDGIQLFHDEVSVYAINHFNSASCPGVKNGGSASLTGPWRVSPSHLASSQYLEATVGGTIDAKSATVTFRPSIQQSGYYSVNLYTPGCLQDASCGRRGQVQIKIMSESGKEAQTISLYQTNNYPKYDQVFFGFIQADGFQPSIELSPLPDQNLAEQLVVAQRISFSALTSMVGLGGLFEFDPQETNVNARNFTNSPVNKLSTGFTRGSAVNALDTNGETTYIAGNFTSDRARNIIAVRGESVEDLDGGLNGAVHSMYRVDTKLYFGGKFNNVRSGSVAGLSNLAIYDTQANSFTPVGGGVNGRVQIVAPVRINLGGSSPEVAIAFNGAFTKLNSFNGNPESDASGLAIWVPSRSNWLSNLKGGNIPGLTGHLSSSLVNLPDKDALLSGSVVSTQIASDGSGSLFGTGDVLRGAPVKLVFPPSGNTSGTKGKRAATNADDIRGVVTGAYYTENNKNLTILGGRFDAKTSDGSDGHNLIIVDGSDNNRVSSLPSTVSSNSLFQAVGISQDTLFAGGRVSGVANGMAVGGIISYNLLDRTLNAVPALSGGDSMVSAIAVRPKTNDVYVAGGFTMAGELGCPGVCMFNKQQQQWQRPGINARGSANSLMWANDHTLFAGGSLIVNDTSTFLAQYDANRQAWDTFPGGTSLPGPVSIVAAGTNDGTQFWVAGHNVGTPSATKRNDMYAVDSASSNVMPYLMKYDGSKWNSVANIFGAGTVIRSLQSFSLREAHKQTPLLDKKLALMMTGSIVIPGFGTASAAMYDGEKLHPFSLSSGGATPGTISRIFTEKSNFFAGARSPLPIGFVILIALAISLALMALVIGTGFLLDRMRKKREGYMPAPTTMAEREGGLQKVPPADLLGSMAQRATPPRI